MARSTAVAVALLLCLGVARAADEPPPRNTKGVPKNVTVADSEKPATMLNGNATGVGG